MLAAQVILITTPDDGVAEVAEELARIGAEELRGKIVLHTSGALELERPRSRETVRGGRWLDASVADVQRRGVCRHSKEKFLRSRATLQPCAWRGKLRARSALLPVHIEGGKKPLYHAAGSSGGRAVCLP